MKKKWPPNAALAKLLRLDVKLHRGKITEAQYQELLARIRRFAEKEAPGKKTRHAERTR